MRCPRLLAISDRRRSRRRDLDPWFEGLAAAGVEAVQIREKDLSDRELLGLVSRAREILGPRVLLLVNGRADIAIAGGADGVHLPSRGIPAAPLRRRFGEKMVIGVSTHELEEIEAARDAGADYATFGPVYRTPSKERYGPPAGLLQFARAASLGLPLLALGGVTIKRLSEVVAAGAAGAAGIGMFLEREAARRAVAAATAVFGGTKSS